MFKAVGLGTKTLPFTAPTFCARCAAKSVVKCGKRGQKSETLAAWRSSEVITENRRGTPGGDLEKYLAQWADRRTSWFNPP